jgi:hypothetical protein
MGYELRHFAVLLGASRGGLLDRLSGRKLKLWHAIFGDTSGGRRLLSPILVSCRPYTIRAVIGDVNAAATN